MDYDDFNGVVDANDHDHNDSMEDDLFAAVIRHSAANEGSDAAHTDTDETHWMQMKVEISFWCICNAFTII